MTKKKLVWRLKEQPTADSLAKLVSNGIISKEDAKEILCSSETEEDRDKKSLQAEIKFLRELVEKLSNKGQIVQVIREFEGNYKPHPWYEPYWVWSNGYSITTDGQCDSVTLTNTITEEDSSFNFSDIETF